MNETILYIILGIAIGLLVGWLVSWLLYRLRWMKAINSLNTEKNNLQNSLDAQKKALEEYKGALLTTFKAAAGDALGANNEQFLALANSKLGEQIKVAEGDLDERKSAIEEMLKPVKDSIDTYKKRIEELEKGNEKTFGQVTEMLTNLQSTNTVLRKETTALVNALKNPRVRGKWGEIGLKRVVEFSGMSAHCDFIEQVYSASEDGILKPDMIVNLPGGGHVVVDSKLPLDAYLEALETDDDGRRDGLLTKHTKDLRAHISALSKKAYWSQFSNTPDFVVLYMEVESAFNVAMMTDRALLQDAMNNKIILATPTTLMVILKSVALTWQQHNVTENAMKIMEAGKELHDRLGSFAGHIAKVGNGLRSAVAGFNSAVGSWENRILPTGRKLEQLEATKKNEELPMIEKLEEPSRTISSVEDIGVEDKGNG